ncbi:MAG: Kelch repeat-containing protein [Polyangiales bacterium]
MRGRSAGVAPLLVGLALGCTSEGPKPDSKPKTEAVRVAEDLRTRIAVEPRSPVDLRVAFSTSARAPLFLERVGQPGVSLSIVAEDVEESAPVDVDEHTRVFVGARSGIDVVQTTTNTGVEELRSLRVARATLELRYHVTLGPALLRLRVVDDIVEAFDENDVARLRTTPAWAIDARGVRRALQPNVEPVDRGRFLLRYLLDARDLAAPIAIDPAWTTTGELALGRINFGGAMLPGKKLIVFGGRALSGITAASEIYDAATASWTAGPSLARPRMSPGVVTFSDGRVMACAGAGATETSSTSDVYDPKTNKFTAAAAAPLVFGSPRGVVLAGDVALYTGPAGGAVYELGTNKWSTTAAFVTPRGGHASVVLPDGKAIILGGANGAGVVLSSVESFDPATKTFTAFGSMSSPREGFTANVAGGRVVVVGGSDGTSLLDTVDVFDPTKGTWSPGPKLPSGRDAHSAVTLPDGRLLVVGGQTLSALVKDAWMLDATASSWLSAGALAHARSNLALLPIDAAASSVFAIAGYDGSTRKDVEVFTPVAIGIACTGAGECATSHCVDGFCCDKSACAADETCGGAASAGTCKKKNGQPCTTGDVCGSGKCVDGVCCDSACNGLCEACDVTATPGSCTTLPPGDKPHGTTRGGCPGSGACQALCGGVDRNACTVFPGATTSCGAATCSDGEESRQSFCDGAGACVDPTKTKCEPFACGATACKKACAADADCAAGFTCATRTGKCVFGAKCDGDHTVVVPDAPSIDCTPYRCAGAACVAKCATSDDCLPGTTCDVASGACVPTNGASDSSSGCAVGTSSADGGTAWLVALLGLSSMRRRRVAR